MESYDVKIRIINIMGPSISVLHHVAYMSPRQQAYRSYPLKTPLAACVYSIAGWDSMILTFHVPGVQGPFDFDGSRKISKKSWSREIRPIIRVFSFDSAVARRARTSQFFDNFLNCSDSELLNYKLSIWHSPYPLGSGGTWDVKIVESRFRRAEVYSFGHEFE